MIRRFGHWLGWWSVRSIEPVVLATFAGVIARAFGVSPSEAMAVSVIVVNIHIAAARPIHITARFGRKEEDGG